jgi:hypothetical protein
MYMKLFIAFVFCLSTHLLFAQVTGGESVYQFLRLPNSAHASGMGGMVVSNPSNDVSFGFANPALLRSGIHNQLALNQNFHLSGTSITNLMYAHHSNKYKTTFAGGLTYVNYGKIRATYTNGIIYNQLFATDVALQLSASKNYKTNWRYGTSLKFVSSQLGSFNSIGVMADAGIVYYDTAKQLYFGMLAKNIGFQLSKYSAQSGNEPLPFDMQIGLSKKLAKAPFRLNVIAHHLYQWNIRYDNPLDKIDNSFFGTADTVTSNYFADKLFRHFNFGVDLLLGKRLEINVAYSHQRRTELALKEKLGMAGFSFGLGVHLPKLDVHYARNIYNLAGNYNQIGIHLKMKELFGLGKTMDTGWY